MLNSSHQIGASGSREAKRNTRLDDILSKGKVGGCIGAGLKCSTAEELMLLMFAGDWSAWNTMWMCCR